MLEGLEISEVNYSRIETENRYDSEYFKQVFLKAESYLNSKKHFNLGSKYKVTDGEHGSVVIQDSGIKYLTAENIKKGYVDISKVRFVDEEVDKRNARARVNIGDILISIKGTLGEIAVAEEWLLPANMNRDVAIIKPLTKEFPSEYVALFMMSEYGALQSLRGGSGGVQQMITLERLRKFVIPFFSNDFSEITKALYNEAKNCRIESQNKYSQAETLLLETLSLNDFEPSNEPVNIKNFKESFGSSGRLDAEYYQPKYDDIEAKILGTKHQKLSDYFKLLSNPSPKNYDDSGTKVIKTKNIRIPSVEIENITDHTNEKSLKVKKDDLLFASMGVGSLGRLSYIDFEIENCTIDGTIKLFRTNDLWKNKNIEIPTLLYLTSNIGQEIIYKYVIGSTGIISISKENIENLPIPIFEKSDCTKLTKMVIDSINLKSQSEQLLVLAKTAVEIAIEENEEIAEIYINEKLTELKITIDHA